MKTARLALVGVAILTGAVASYLALNVGSAPPPEPAKQAEAPRTDMIEVLTVSAEKPVGHTLLPDDLAWVPWPASAFAPEMIRKVPGQDQVGQIRGHIVRSTLYKGDPLRADKLIKPDGSGMMSALLPAGKRAVAVSVSSNGSSTAGNFILPNDRVDLIRSYRDEGASKAAGVDVYQTEVVLQNARVLAIGPNIEERKGQPVVVGETVTFELDPNEAEAVALIQTQRGAGTFTLALRSFADRNQPATQSREKDSSITVVRFGVPTVATTK